MAKRAAERGKKVRAKSPADPRHDALDPNTVQPTGSREGRRKSDAPGTAAPHRQARGKATENSIRPVKRRVVAVDSPKAVRRDSEAVRDPEARVVPSAGAGHGSGQTARADNASPERRRHVPEHIRQRFVQVGRHYHFPDGTRAFTDRGGRLTTPSENTEVIRSLVTIAEARGWNEITVRGTERFRKEAWVAARLAGLEVRGYRPTEFEQSRVARMLARGLEDPGRGERESSPGARSGSQSTDGAHEHGPRSEGQSERQGRRDGLVTGRLVDHGRATYRHDPREPMSYFVKIETPRGDRTIWGVDLERAFRESLTQPKAGDEVGLRAVGQDAVTVRAPERDTDGEVVAERDLVVHRNRWIVEKRAFFTERAEAARMLRDRDLDPKQAVKRHPELVGTYLQVRAAELAARQFRDAEDRERFVSQVRAALADGVARGEPLPPVRLRERSAERASARSHVDRVHEPAPARG
jgi:putative DNA primase/helicase